MGGTWLPQEFRDYIRNLYLDADKAGKKLSGAAIYRKLHSSLTVKQQRWEIPTVKTIQNIIKPLKDPLSEDEKNQEKPWSFYNLTYYPIPVESIHVLLQLWRYAVNTYQKFSIRQAKWAARLYLTLTDITDLWFESQYLADMEYRTVVSGYSMNDFKTLYYLIMSETEQCIPLFSHKKEMSHGQPFSGMLTHRSTVDGGIVEEEPIFNLDWEEDLELYNRDSSILFNYLFDIPSSQILFKNIDYRMIYLRHLFNLSKGPKWSSLSRDEVIEIIISLRQWVNNIEENPEQMEEDEFTGNPQELYTRVGIDLSQYDLNPFNVYNENDEFFKNKESE